MPIDKPTAEALAVVAIASRPPGATRWDAAGILAALRKVHHLEAGEVAATKPPQADLSAKQDHDHTNPHGDPANAPSPPKNHA